MDTLDLGQTRGEDLLQSIVPLPILGGGVGPDEPRGQSVRFEVFQKPIGVRGGGLLIHANQPFVRSAKEAVLDAPSRRMMICEGSETNHANDPQASAATVFLKPAESRS